MSKGENNHMTYLEEHKEKILAVLVKSKYECNELLKAYNKALRSSERLQLYYLLKQKSRAFTIEDNNIISLL